MRRPGFPRALTGELEPAVYLLAGQLLMFVGIAGLFPIVPLYVAHRGGGSVAIAAFVAGPLVLNTLVQVPAGRLVDRVGRRPVLIGSRLAYAVVALALFADLGPLPVLLVLRCMQGVTSGAYVPALRAALTDLTPPERRGERFSQLQACEMVGLLVGPLVGGAIALWRDNGCFLFAGVTVLAGLGAIRRVPETRGCSNLDAPAPRGRWWARRGLLVPCVALAAVGCMFSTYDVIWPQYLAVRGYSSLVIGLTISTFAVPILVLARPLGRFGDRHDRRPLLAGALAVAAACALAYPALRSLAPILALGCVEAVAFTAIEPSCFALVSRAAPVDIRGRAMGFAGFFEFGGSALGSAVLGSLYGVAEAIPFRAGAGLLFAAAVTCMLALPRDVARSASLADTDTQGVVELEALP